MRTPDVTVVIPAYGAGGLSRAIGSALSQRGVRVEVVVVDDGSPEPLQLDGWLDHFAVRLVRKEENTGPGSTRNHGVNHARSSCLAFLDADDEWAPGKLAAQLPLLEEGTAVVSDYVVDGDSGSPHLVRLTERSLSSPAYNWLLHPSSLVVARSDFEAVEGISLRTGTAPRTGFCSRDCSPLDADSQGRTRNRSSPITGRPRARHDRWRYGSITCLEPPRRSRAIVVGMPEARSKSGRLPTRELPTWPPPAAIFGRAVSLMATSLSTGSAAGGRI